MYHTHHSTEQNWYHKTMGLQFTFLENFAISDVQFSLWLYVTSNFPAGLSEAKEGPKLHSHSKAQLATRACFIHYTTQSPYTTQPPTGQQ